MALRSTWLLAALLLPLAAAPGEGARPVDAAPPRQTEDSSRVGRTVLLVDDEENLRLMLRTLLRKGGYEVEVAASGHEALARLEQGGIDFVLTDLRMPRMGGLELLREAQGRGVAATFVVMSAYGSLDLAIDAMKAGAYDYISKPFKPDEIILTLRKAEERESAAGSLIAKA